MTIMKGIFLGAATGVLLAILFILICELIKELKRKTK